MGLRAKNFDPSDPVYEDLLRDSTRRVRRALLLVGVVGLFAVVAEVYPAELPSVGIEFGEGSKGLILWAALGTLSYFWVWFYFRARIDVSRFCQAVLAYHLNKSNIRLTEDEPDEEDDKFRAWTRAAMDTRSLSVWAILQCFWFSDMSLRLQLLIEWALPLVLGMVAAAGLTYRLLTM